MYIVHVPQVYYMYSLERILVQVSCFHHIPNYSCSSKLNCYSMEYIEYYNNSKQHKNRVKCVN